MSFSRTSTQKAFRIGTIAAMVAAAVTLLQSPGAAAGNIKNIDWTDNVRALQGFAMAPVQLNLRKKNRMLVGLGSYLVNAVGGCNDCHTSPSYSEGGDPFLGQTEQINVAGYLGGGRVFGPFVARNLTPDSTGLPGGATFSEFDNTMRSGIDPHAAHPQFGPFLQVMAWPVYRNMTPLDMRAVYEYLRAIPCIDGNPGLPPIVDRCDSGN
jgi:hypothetical protein